MKKCTIVGAGLAGLTASIILARQGRDVEVLEQKKAVGGAAIEMEELSSRPHAFADMTPFDMEGLSSYLGFEIAPSADGTPFFKSLPYARFHCFGKKYDMVFPENLHMTLVERGKGASSLDTHLYKIAERHGVSFRFGTRLSTKADFSALPPQTILATGMFREAFLALGIPHKTAWGFLANTRLLNYKGPETVVYLDKYIKDYGYFTIVNDVGGAMLFQRDKPIPDKAKKWFVERLKNNEGIEFPEWMDAQTLSATPTGSIFNPRLFQDRFILAGTLAGFQDPSMVLGVHGALVSGKIAAMALSDRDKAVLEFKRMNKWWRSAFMVKRLIDRTHPLGVSLMGSAILSLTKHIDQRYLWLLYPAVPGWMRLKKAGYKNGSSES